MRTACDTGRVVREHGATQRVPERLQWHMITSEYPPQPGGVSDYSCWVAGGLAEKGDEVHVWCPSADGVKPSAPGVAVHQELGRISPRDLRRVGSLLNEFPKPRRILVQWVPHGYRYRSMNLAFCAWLWKRSAWDGDRVVLMVHEPCLSFWEGSWRQNIVAAVHRLMIIMLMQAAGQVWVSIPGWERVLRPYRLGRRVAFKWQPIPSNIPVADDPAATREVRQRYAAGNSVLVGHFGTYSRPIVSLLEPVLMSMSENSSSPVVLLMGRGSGEFRKRLIAGRPGLAEKIHETGELVAEAASSHLAACDILIQPYPDGASSRRGSLLAGLCHGKAIVTTIGRLTEPFWESSGAVALAEAGNTEAFLEAFRRLRTDASRRRRMGEEARKLYKERFDLGHTIEAFRGEEIESLQEPACAS